MKLSAPTQVVFIISLVLAVIGTLPLLGVALPSVTFATGWILVLAYIVLAAGVLFKKF